MSYSFYITPEQYAEASKNGITPSTLEQRIRDRAWPLEKAITTPPRQRKSFGKWTKIAVSNGINPHTFRARINVWGWDYEKAATTPATNLQENMRRIRKETRVYPKEFTDLAKANGICERTLYSRLSRDWGLEKACSVKPIKA